MLAKSISDWWVDNPGQWFANHAVDLVVLIIAVATLGLIAGLLSSRRRRRS